MLFNPKNGNLVVIKTSAFKRLFGGAKIPTHKIAFCDQEVLDQINQLGKGAK
jgi:hypothetical protein